MNWEIQGELNASQFDFHLPQSQIAQFPVKERTDSRLLVLDRKSSLPREIPFSGLLEVLQKGDLLVCNNTKVIRARLKGRKSTGGSVEILVERIIDENKILGQARARRTLKPGSEIIVNEQNSLVVCGRKDKLFLLQTGNNMNAEALVSKFGEVPLPPYIKRSVNMEDETRYQTVFAKRSGSVAAPTAGLHFSEAMLNHLVKAGIEIVYVTLHIGSGTFAPVRNDDFDSHKMHSEYCELNEEACSRILQAKECGRRVIAVGTTSVRTLETAAMEGYLKPYCGETDLYIKPGFAFKVIDAMITNFHLPRSTLLLLVCAFGGIERVMNAYQHAIDSKFRFYSYGDAMFLEASD